jgi:sulfate adenylyltransferase subunit 1 (EFTu-like GTPase family)
MHDRPLRPGGRYVLKHTTRTTLAAADTLSYTIDVNSLSHDEDAASLRLNQIGRVSFRTSAPLVWDPYERNRITGSFIVIDESTNDTLGAGMIVAAARLRRGLSGDPEQMSRV